MIVAAQHSQSHSSLTTSLPPTHSTKMDAITIPTEGVPSDLAPIEQTLKRAAELKKVDPVISYWCGCLVLPCPPPPPLLSLTSPVDEADARLFLGGAEGTQDPEPQP